MTKRRLEIVEKLRERVKPYEWKKGFKPPGAGHPFKHLSLVGTLKEILGEPAANIPELNRLAIKMGFDPKHTTVGSLLCSQAIVYAMRGNTTFYQDIMDRCEGKVSQSLRITNSPPEFMPGATEEEIKERIKNAAKRLA